MKLRTLAAAAAFPLLLSLSACSGDDGGSTDDNSTPTDVLAEAKKTLDDTPGVHLVLETPQLPEGLAGVVKAEGTATHQPAFEGTIAVVIGGIPVDVKVIAVDGKVNAILPFTAGYTAVNPEEYGAPDPAGLMDPDSGISAWLTRAEGVEKGDQTRDGSDILTTYSGTLDGASVVAVIPSADDAGSFDAAFTIDDDGQLRSATVTGPFYKGEDDVTYEVTLTEYGTDEEIQAP